ncbi:MAG: UbiD family decarboxylase [Gammaproteobacteria bacterium]|nr:UbiD family decarboxylase [Gammaproteobacteria bacterium]
MSEFTGFRDFREFLTAAEQRGLLRRIRRTVDRSWEPACLAKLMFHGLPMEQRFGFHFDKVDGSEFPLVTAAIGASISNYALALGVEPERINDRWNDALNRLVPPTIVATAPCQEVVRLGRDARLGALPIPVWTPRKDAGPYITTVTVNRSAETGIQNMGVYRTQVRDDHSVIVNLSPGRQGHEFAQTYLKQGEPAPIAWVVAADPAVYLAAVANLPIGFDEIMVAGGLRHDPVELVRAQTSNLFVPANAEIVIEGEVLPGRMATEGPFGESAGYMSGTARRPVARITAITHRRNALYYGLSSQMPPSESTVMQSLSNAGLYLHMLRKDYGETSVRDAYIDLMFGGGASHITISMTPEDPEHAKRVGRIVADNTLIKRITIVDADIDIRDRIDMDWVMSAHFDPARDTEIVGGFPMPADHAVSPDEQGRKMGGKIIIDATRSVDTGANSLPPRELMLKAREIWRDEGLPEIEIAGRLRKRLDRG